MSRTLLIAALALPLSLEIAWAQDRTAQAGDSTQARPSTTVTLRPFFPRQSITPSLLSFSRVTLSRDSSIWALDPQSGLGCDFSVFVSDFAVALSVYLGCGDDNYCQRYLTGVYEGYHGEISVWADMTAWALSFLFDDWLDDTALFAHNPSAWRFPDPP